MRRFAFVAEVEFTLPPIEKLKSAHRIGDLVAEIVGPAAVRVDIVKMLVQGLGKEPGDYVEVLVMMRELQRSLLAPSQGPAPAFLQCLRVLPLGRRSRRRGPRSYARSSASRLVGA